MASSNSGEQPNSQGMASPNSGDVGSRLRKLAMHGDTEALKAALDEHADFIESPNASGKTPLVQAAWRGSLANVQLLLDYGANANAYTLADHNLGKSALFVALSRRRDDVAHLLLDKGATVKVRTVKGLSILELARYKGVGQDLVDRIADLETDVDNDTNTPWLDFTPRDEQGRLLDANDKRAACTCLKCVENRTRLESKERQEHELTSILPLEEADDGHALSSTLTVRVISEALMVKNTDTRSVLDSLAGEVSEVLACLWRTDEDDCRRLLYEALESLQDYQATIDRFGFKITPKRVQGTYKTISGVLLNGIAGVEGLRNGGLSAHHVFPHCDVYAFSKLCDQVTFAADWPTPAEQQVVDRVEFLLLKNELPEALKLLDLPSLKPVFVAGGAQAALPAFPPSLVAHLVQGKMVELLCRAVERVPEWSTDIVGYLLSEHAAAVAEEKGSEGVKSGMAVSSSFLLRAATKVLGFCQDACPSSGSSSACLPSARSPVHDDSASQMASLHQYIEMHVLNSIVDTNENWFSAWEYAENSPELEAVVVSKSITAGLLTLTPEENDEVLRGQQLHVKTFRELRRRAVDAADAGLDDAKDSSEAKEADPAHDFEVVWVDNAEAALRFSAEVKLVADDTTPVDAPTPVAFDCEWRHPRPISLIQIAFCRAGQAAVVFLLDTIAADETTRCLIEEGVVSLFMADKRRVQMIGFSPGEDMRRLRKHFTSMDQLHRKQSEANLIDLQKVHAQENSKAAGQVISLAALVRLELGVVMNKRQQCSNWDRRPLSESQLSYAALDAEILLRLRTAMKSRTDSTAVLPS